MDLLKTKIQPLIEEAVEGLGVDSSLVGRMLQPSTGHTWPPVCDLSLPCFQFAKRLGMAPPAIAELLSEKIGEHEAIQEGEALNGFLNITASPSWLAQQPVSYTHLTLPTKA